MRADAAPGAPLPRPPRARLPRPRRARPAPRRALLRASLLALGVAWLALGAALALRPDAAVAQAELALHEPPPHAPHTLLVYPTVPVYLDLDQPAPTGALDPVALRSALQRHLAHHPYVRLASSDAARRAVRAQRGVDIEGALSDADNYRQWGIQSFFGFNLDTARVELEKALFLYQPHAALLAPERLAEVHQYLAYTLLEQHTLGAATVDQQQIDEHFEAMVRLAPERRVNALSDPPERVERYNQARRRFLRLMELRDAHLPDLAELLRRPLPDLDHVLFARLVQKGDALWLEVRVHDVDRGLIAFRDEIALPADPAAALERVDALASRFVACLIPHPPPPEVAASERGRVYVDLAFSFMRFMSGPTTEPFNNLGASFSGTYMFTDHFSFVGRLNLNFSGRDIEGDLLTNFNTVRGILGVGLSVDVGWFRFYFQSGLEAAVMSNLAATSSIVCKVWGAQEAVGECPEGQVEIHSSSVLSGLHSTVGFNLGWNPAFFFAQLGASVYLIPFNDEKAVNYPLSVELGAQYRF